MRKRMTVSEARAKLFDLVEYVTETPDAAVVIEHRDRKERAVLVDESHYQYLEAMVREYKKRVPDSPFKLAGSMTPPEGDDTDLGEVIDQVRREYEAGLQRKLDEMFADD